MANVSLQAIKKIYPNGVCAVQDFNLEIKDGAFVIFVGPSGCGKSTTLRMIAGLEEITDGKLYIAEEEMNQVAAKDRNIAMVFQNYALYPHLTVFENMAFSLQLKKMPKTEIRKRIENIAQSLEIPHLLYRYPAALSGGERQRVALGRALVRQPKVFLFDEPLSNLDAKLRATMRQELKSLHQKLKATFVYVTHDQVEAMTMGDIIVVMKDGVIQQAAIPKEIFKKPSNLFVAKFIGSPAMNIFPGKVEVDEHGNCFLVFGQGLRQPLADKWKIYAGSEYLVGVRPGDIHVVREDAEKMTFDVDIERLEHLGAETYVYGKIGDISLTIVTSASESKTWLGEKKACYILAEDILLFHPETEMRIGE